MELAIMLLKLKRRFDKTLKPTAMYEFIFASEIPFTHKIRVKLALIFAYSSNFKPDAALVNISRQIITKNENNNAVPFFYISTTGEVKNQEATEEMQEVATEQSSKNIQPDLFKEPENDLPF